MAEILFLKMLQRVLSVSQSSKHGELTAIEMIDEYELAGNHLPKNIMIALLNTEIPISNILSLICSRLLELNDCDERFILIALKGESDSHAFHIK